MATILVLDDNLIREAQQISGYPTVQAVVTVALQEYVQRKKQLQILHLFNEIEYDNDNEYKEQRRFP